jgi:hypothetical protein
MLSPRSHQKELQMSVMNPHAMVVLEEASEEPSSDADLHDRPSDSPDRPTLAERLGETVPLICAPAFFGPPVIFLLGPWLLLTLLIIPPAALLITMVVVFLLGAGLLVALGAVIASPYLLVRHLRARHRLSRLAPATSEVAGARGQRPVKQSLRPGLIHLTTR